MKPDLLLMQAMLDRTEKSMAEICEVQRLFAASDRDAFFESVAHQIRAVATGGMIGLSRKLMDRMPALEIIAVNGIGTGAVDLDEARRRGVRVTKTPDVLTDDVADMAMALRRSVDFVRVIALFAPGVGPLAGCRLHVE
jgi:lactate dehydrogenase-like 2-hydroxyacid dehydrogenase